MTVLTALKDCYDRLAEDDDSGIPAFGYKVEQISFAVRVTPDGGLIDIVDLRDQAGLRLRPRRMLVPLGERTSGIRPRFLWDNSSYLLGISAKSKRTREEHVKFVDLQDQIINGHNDPGLRSVSAFLRNWSSADFEIRNLNREAVDTNLVFHLDGDRMFIHERPAAKELWLAQLARRSPGRKMVCLVTGKSASVALTHSKIRNLRGPQAETAITSFNQDAFASYGKEQNENAPVSEEAAFGYTTALNHLLRPGSPNRVQIADASTVFWAESRAPAEEALVAALFAPPADDADASRDTTSAPRFDAGEAARIRNVLSQIVKGRPLRAAAPELRDDTRFYVLGLAPNAARISIRFWHVDSLGNLAARFAEHYRDLWIEPPSWRTAPAVWRLLYETAVQRKAENIPPNLGGEVMRAILTGNRYPRSLLAAVIVRMRAEGVVNGLRAAICKACLARDFRKGIEKEDVPMGLDRSNLNPGYRLGRLFAVLESVQRAALGREINATIRDKYYGAASATPASIFPLLIANANHHLSRVRKDQKGGLAFSFERDIGDILSAFGDSLPRSLRIEDQGRFAIGYYHQRFGSKSDAAQVEATEAAESVEHHDQDEG